MQEPLLSVRNLETRFFTDDGVVKAVDNISFDLAPREILGVVGESGSGKSVTSLSVLRLVSAPGENHRRRNFVERPRSTEKNPSAKCARFAATTLR
jgi:ABC-type dipeptide/oligopeptide/nickel transport system ATPase component